MVSRFQAGRRFRWLTALVSCSFGGLCFREAHHFNGSLCFREAHHSNGSMCFCEAHRFNGSQRWCKQRIVGQASGSTLFWYVAGAAEDGEESGQPTCLAPLAVSALR